MENAGNETFDNFGDPGNMNMPVGEEQGQQIEGENPQEEVVDFENMSLEDICKKFGFEVIPKETVFPNFTQVMAHNKYHKLYLAKTDNFGPCSLLILNDAGNKKLTFASLMTKLSLVMDVNCKGLLKIKGVSIVDSSVYFLFEPILSSYRNKIKEKSALDSNFKFVTLFYLIELAQFLHEKRVNLIEVRPSNILYNNLDEFRFIIPFRK
jgi:serine/threonine protein kinase